MSMYDWEKIFGSYSDSGVFAIGKVPAKNDIKKAATAAGLDYTRIDLKKVVDKASMLKTIALALRFPAYFGLNWDALEECLTDLSWKPASGYVILFAGFKSISEKLTSESQIFSNILDSSARHWKEKRTPFYVILSG